METPNTPTHRRPSLMLLRPAWCAWCVMAFAGCMGPILRPTTDDPKLPVSLDDEAPSQTRLVGRVAHPYGMNYVKVENVALVTSLNGTGEDPAPSPQRAALLAEMNRRGVEDPNHVLASPNTALVLVRAFLRPGIQKGETFDIEVRAPSKSDTTSLRGGTLLETRLSETAVLGGQIRTGHEAAIAQGPILVDPTADPVRDTALATKGRVLSGGVAIKSRKLGLILDHQHKGFGMSTRVGKAVNERFHTYVDGYKMGVATPKTDEYIELILHPRYKENVARYMKVVRSIAVQESPAARLERLEQLRNQLLDPVTTETAALRLEAIGNDEAISILKEGAKSSDTEVSFYAAEALAYLDVTEAVAPLAKIAVEQAAFRINALAALGGMQDGAAAEALFGMLDAKSGETRYGAFRALTTMAPDDPRIRAERLGAKFNYHVLDVGGPPMIHVTSSHRPEIVLFGREHQFKLPLVVDAGQKLLVNSRAGSGEVTISRFGPSEPTQQRTVSARVDDVIRAVVDLGGDYPDVVQMLQQAKQSGALPSRFRVNALPEPGRQYDRDQTAEHNEAELAAAD